MGMTRTTAPIVTREITVTTRKIYVKAEHEPTWQRAVKHAKTEGMSLSEVVARALRQMLDATDANA